MSKYKLRTVGRLSSRPIMSIGSYISLDAECLVAGSSDRHLRFLDKDDLVEVAKCRVEKKSVNFVSISDMSPEGDDPIIVTGGKDSSVQIWNPSDGSLEKNIELPTKEVRSLAIYQGTETYLVIGTKEAKVIVWDVKRNVLVKIFEGHKASVHCVLISSPPVDFDTQNDMDFLCIASGGADRTVRTWDLKTGKRRKKFRHKRSIAAMVVANKGIRPLLATAGVERAVKLWDVETGVLLRTLDGHLDQINCLTLWEGYQMLLISGSSDHTIRIYDILSGECIIILQGHNDAVLGVAISDKDHPKIVSCSDDMTLIQWSLEEIISDFFCTDDENLGARNIVPAFLPDLDYVAPAEPDRKALTKEERRQLRREQKREKKIRSSKHATVGTIIHNPNLLGSPAGMSQKHQTDYDDDDDEFDPYKEDFEDEINEDLYETQLRLQQEEAARLAAAAAAEEEQAAYGGGLMSPGGSTKVMPEELRGVEPAGTVTVRKASIMVMKNIMGKVMGMGGSSAAVEPLDLSGEASAAAGGNKRGSVGPADGKSEEANLRAQANAAQNKFNIAEVEKELEIERKKQAAADKLAFRLNMKKLQKGTGAEGEDQLADLGQMELQAQKTEKLRQHKLQESRRHQSMLVAKERSANALQKRLAELAAQRQNLPATFEEEDSDDSSDEKKSRKKKGNNSGNGEETMSPNGQNGHNGSSKNQTEGGESPAAAGAGGVLALNKKKVIYISDDEYESPIDD